MSISLRQHKRRAAAGMSARLVIVRVVTGRHFGGALPTHLSVSVGFQVVSYQHPRARGGRKVRWQYTPAVHVDGRSIPRCP